LKKVQRLRTQCDSDDKAYGTKGENGFDKFPGIRFMSSDAPPYSRNTGKETEVKTN